MVGVVNADCMDSVHQLFIFVHVTGYTPYVGIHIGGDDFDSGKVVVVEGFSKQLYVFGFVRSFVPDAAEVDVEVVVFFCTFYEGDDEVGVVLRVEVSVSNPCWSRPLEAVEVDVGVSLFCLFHKEPFIAAVIVFRHWVFKFFASVGVGRFGSVGGVSVSADFDFEVMEGCAVVWFEEVIKDLALVFRRVVDKES